VRHDNITGKRKVILDGVVIFDRKGFLFHALPTHHTKILIHTTDVIFPDRTSTHTFEIKSKCIDEEKLYKGEVFIEYDMTTGWLSDVIYYKLEFNGEKIVHSMQYSIGIEPFDFLERTRVSIPEFKLKTVDSKSVTVSEE
jgi:hypothetical protein